MTHIIIIFFQDKHAIGAIQHYREQRHAGVEKFQIRDIEIYNCIIRCLAEKVGHIDKRRKIHIASDKALFFFQKLLIFSSRIVSSGHS